jgi:predicted ribosome quality control (RQC) complex YloA/Tae2 family protein
MNSEKIKKLQNEIQSIDDQLSLIDETLSSSDEISVHELYEKEAVLMAKRYSLISQYEQLISY